MDKFLLNKDGIPRATASSSKPKAAASSPFPEVSVKLTRPAVDPSLQPWGRCREPAIAWTKLMLGVFLTVEKYRPKTIDEVSAQESTISVLRKSLEQSNVSASSCDRQTARWYF
jgi:hypothetical protein